MSTIEFPQDRKFNLLGLGRACVDLNANEINRPMEETRTFTKYVGGSPANITLAAARLGLKTGFIGRVANEQFGRFIRHFLDQNGIDTSRIVTDMSGSSTGLAFTEIKSPTDCSILMYRDNTADLNLQPSDIDEEYIRSSQTLLVSGTALARSPSREAVFLALQYARKHGVVIIFDIDFRNYTWKSKEETSIYCNLVAEKSDIIIGGREEFDIMEATTDPVPQDDASTAHRWFDHHAKLVIVKHGGDGSVAFAKGGEVYRAGVFPAVNVIKTFGAGDSFAGAFIYGLMQGWPIDRCQMFGSASASIVVSKHNSSEAMPTAEEIQAYIDEHIGNYQLRG